MKTQILVLAALLSISMATFNNVGKTPAMGWTAYDKFVCSKMDEDEIKKQVGLVKSLGLDKSGYQYVNLDSCWMYDKRFQGELVGDVDRFPSGIEAMSKYVHDADLKFGLHLSSGGLTCNKKPGSQNWESSDARRIAEFEVDYIRYDVCYANKTPFPAETDQVRFERMQDALKSVERPIYYAIDTLGLGDFQSWANKTGNSWRTYKDVQPTWKSI